VSISGPFFFGKNLPRRSDALPTEKFYSGLFQIINNVLIETVPKKLISTLKCKEK
jgi:hypothetical protein